VTPGEIRERLEGARAGRLATVDARGRPHLVPICFALLGRTLYSAIDEKPKRREPARLRYLRRRPEAALCVDVYDDDWSRLAWVQLLGRVGVLDAAESDAAMDALAAKYAPYRERRPPGPLLRLSVERALCWRASAR
jgi:PPOX class probable F420-dependent enzyme